MDKISYALGLGIGQQIKSMNIENFSIEDFARSIADVLEGKETAFSSREAQLMLQDYFTKKQKEEAQAHIAEGKAYLDANAKKPGVNVTKSGLQYEVLQEGTGKSPKATDTVRCHYEGRLLDGTVASRLSARSSSTWSSSKCSDNLTFRTNTKACADVPRRGFLRQR